MEKQKKKPGMSPSVRMVLLLLAVHQAGAASHMIESCAGLKQAIEAAAAAPPAPPRGKGSEGGASLTLRLSGEAPYICEESILVGEAQTVEVVGDSGVPASNVLVFQPRVKHPGLPPTSRSLFVNEGTLRLSNVRFPLNADGGESAAVSEGGQGGEEEGAFCAGASLVRNSGNVLLEGVEVLESRGAFPARRCRAGEAGRVVSGLKIAYVRACVCVMRAVGVVWGCLPTSGEREERRERGLDFWM